VEFMCLNFLNDKMSHVSYSFSKRYDCGTTPLYNFGTTHSQ
jgi:hypothetical protein